MSKNTVTADLSFTITATISQVCEIPKELYDKIKKNDNDDVDFRNELYDELNDLVAFDQAFSIDEFQNIGIKKSK